MEKLCNDFIQENINKNTKLSNNYENYEELWLPNSVGFLDIHYYEYDDEESGVYDNIINLTTSGDNHDIDISQTD